MRFAGQGDVAQSNSGGGPVHGDMRGRDWGGNPVSNEPVGGWGKDWSGNPLSGGPVHGWPNNKDWGSRIGQEGPRQMDLRDSDSDGIDDRDQLAPWQRNEKGNQIAGGSWLTPYRKEWIRHTSGQQPITDPVRRKELQDIILYPERVMGV